MALPFACPLLLNYYVDDQFVSVSFISAPLVCLGWIVPKDFLASPRGSLGSPSTDAVIDGPFCGGNEQTGSYLYLILFRPPFSPWVFFVPISCGATYYDGCTGTGCVYVVPSVAIDELERFRDFGSVLEEALEISFEGVVREIC